MAGIAPDSAQRMLRSARAVLGDTLVAKLSAPFFLGDVSAPTGATRRLLVYGQETAGWGGENDNRSRGAATLAHWLALDPAAAVSQLADNYLEFYENPERSSPFWRANERLNEALGSDWVITWSNVMRADTSPLSSERKWKSCSAWWNLSYDEVNSICVWQSELQKAELEKLKPDAILFVSGWHYDYCIERSFGSFERAEVLGRDTKVAARLVSSWLPAASFRTYHPNYLFRRRQDSLLTDLAVLCADRG